MSERPTKPIWWREEYHCDPLLYACATAGLSELEVIDRMAQRDRERVEDIRRLLLFQPPPSIVLTEDEFSKTGLRSGYGSDDAPTKP